MASNAKQQPSPEEDQAHHPISAQLLKAAAQASAQDSSGESGAEDDASPDNPEQAGRRKKRSRACQACRNMKIRCEPVDGQEACKSCAKVNRECIMPGPARKRQKTVHKVAELEKKIDALTNSLLARRQSHPTPPQDSPSITERSRSTTSVHQSLQQPEKDFTYGPAVERPVYEDNFYQSSQPGRTTGVQEYTNEYADVVDRGILSMETASRMFELFKNEMNPLCPIVAFADSASVQSIRRKRPMVFLTALSATSGVFAPALQSDLQTELAREVAHKVFYLSEKSLDLIQAMLLLSSWTGRHKDSKDLAFNQYIHSSLVMAYDLGMGKRLRTPLAKDAMEDAELRRTWLACYYNAACVATTMRHPSLVRNSAYLDECLEVLSTSPVANPSDMRLCALVKIVQIMEDVSRCFHMDDAASSVRLEDAATQYQLRLFAKRLEEWKTENGRHFHPLVLEHINAVVSLYIHEIAMHDEHNIDDFRPTDRNNNVEPRPYRNFITTAHLDSLTTCVCNMKQAVESFIAICSNVSRLLPCLHVVWTAYAVVAMIRLHGALQANGTKYADVFMPDLKIEEYLDQIIQQLNEINASYSPIPHFVQAFQKLKLWHKHRLGGGPPFDGFEDHKVGAAPRTMTMFKQPAGNNVPSMQAPTSMDEMVPSMPNALAPPPPGGTQMQGMDSTLLSGNLPIDASMFDNQDWNFTMEDWNNFDASLNEPTGSAWIGYLI